jgi:hypothetical protein
MFELRLLGSISNQYLINMSNKRQFWIFIAGLVVFALLAIWQQPAPPPVPDPSMPAMTAPATEPG